MVLLVTQISGGSAAFPEICDFVNETEISSRENEGEARDALEHALKFSSPKVNCVFRPDNMALGQRVLGQIGRGSRVQMLGQERF